MVLVVFSLLVSIGAIIHGVYMDLDYNQISRLTVEGILLTFFVIFPAILFLEWIFDINNKKRIDELNNRIRKLEKKRK
jgi:hypothetical protein